MRAPTSESPGGDLHLSILEILISERERECTLWFNSVRMSTVPGGMATHNVRHNDNEVVTRRAIWC